MEEVVRLARWLEVSKIVEAPAADAWALLVDTERWPSWGPSITAVDCATRMLGAHGHGRVRTVLGGWLPFEVTSFEEGRAWAWRVGGIRATGHRVDPLGPSRCRVTFEVPALAFLYVVPCRIALRRIARLLASSRGAPGHSA